MHGGLLCGTLLTFASFAPTAEFGSGVKTMGFSGSAKLGRLGDWARVKSVLPVSVKDQPKTPCDKQASTQSSNQFAPGREFFQRNDPRKGRNRR